MKFYALLVAVSAIKLQGDDKAAAVDNSYIPHNANTKPIWALRSVNDHRTDTAVQKGYGDYSTKMANARPALRSNGIEFGDSE